MIVDTVDISIPIRTFRAVVDLEIAVEKGPSTFKLLVLQEVIIDVCIHLRLAVGIPILIVARSRAGAICDMVHHRHPSSRTIHTIQAVHTHVIHVATGQGVTCDWFDDAVVLDFWCPFADGVEVVRSGSKVQA